MITDRHILFDLGGVIFHLNYQLTYQAFKKITGLDQDHFFHQLHQPVFFDQYERGEISNTIFLQHFKKNNEHLKDEDIINAWNAMLIGIPENNLLFIEQLAKNNTLYLLSNTNAIHWKKVEELLMNAGQLERFYTCFNKIFLSFEMGMRKPEHSIYHTCIKKIGISSSELIFIDDNIHNIEAAGQCGLKSLLYPKDNPLLEKTLPTLL